LFYSGYDDERNYAPKIYQSGYPNIGIGAGRVTSLSSKLENRPEIILTGSF